ncbi:MAG TPA: hypothetical protein VGN74_14345 [Brevundimonas sp.]|jgi:uncharacterized protein YgfB (UPF0149 family)|uniref:hypothetical protein n=1 Tax=Brevundimonas sp. TaxID=1871086 RepID=UPI002E0D627C|nr:hypothetical protein [Brevundimonas sp.]
MEPTSQGSIDPEAANLVATADLTAAEETATGPDRLERAHVSLRNAVERLLAEARHGDFVEATDLVRHATHLLQTLDPAALEPRRGLAGLFDGRGARLKRFRALYLPAAASAGDTAAALAERGRSAVRRSTTLDALHAEAVRAIAEVDAALAEGEAQLRATPAPGIVPAAAVDDAPATNPVVDADEAPLPGPEASRSEPLDAEEGAAPAQATTATDSGEEGPVTATVEIEADVEAGDTPSAEPEAGRSEMLEPGDALALAETVGADDNATGERARLESRLEALRAARAAGIAQLPLARAVQNAEHAAPDQLAAAAAALSTWVEDWRQGLGLAGRKPKKIRPDSVALARTRDAALDALVGTERRLASIRARASETEGRMTRVVELVRRAA